MRITHVENTWPIYASTATHPAPIEGCCLKTQQQLYCVVRDASIARHEIRTTRATQCKSMRQHGMKLVDVTSSIIMWKRIRVSVYRAVGKQSPPVTVHAAVPWNAQNREICRRAVCRGSHVHAHTETRSRVSHPGSRRITVCTSVYCERCDHVKYWPSFTFHIVTFNIKSTNYYTEMLIEANDDNRPISAAQLLSKRSELLGWCTESIFDLPFMLNNGN